MREVFECALLAVPGRSEIEPVDCGDRLKLHRYVLGEGIAPEALAGDDVDTTGLIAAAALALQRYDACVLAVEPANLPWARMALARARPLLRTPMLALVREVKAPALVDLLELGVADFMRAPLCPEELRARLMRLAVRNTLREPMTGYGGTPGGAAFAYAIQHKAPRQRARRGSAHGVAMCEPGEPFRQAKARLVEGFERAYLRQALERHQGNVAQAARASRKHRRAFWALMRKHRIEAAPYRLGNRSGD
jgi:DNA-binding NtrC family response regulator